MLARLLDRLRSDDRSANEDDTVVPVAAAALLIEVAWADHDITPDELAVIRRALTEQFDLDPATISDIIEESRQQHEGSVGLYRFTRTINEAWQEAEKFDLVVKLWELALSDEELDRFEEHTIRKTAELLYVSHNRFIEAKQKARKALESSPDP